MDFRSATHKDVPALAALGRDSFRAAFEHLYDPADLSAFLAETYAEDAVAAELASPNCVVRLAEDAAGLAGYCKMRRSSKLAPHSDAANPIELGQLYTAPGRTGQGIGAALMDWALDLARSEGHDAVLLSVYSENFGAQRFYARYGFAKIADITFRVGNQLDAEFLLQKTI